MTNDTGRARKIAALHAWADYLARNLNVPVPTAVIAYTHLAAGDLATVIAQAAEHGTEVKQGGTTVWADLPDVLGGEVKIRQVVITSIPRPERYAAS